jgi:hypothetical protein
VTPAELARRASPSLGDEAALQAEAALASLRSAATLFFQRDGSPPRRRVSPDGCPIEVLQNTKWWQHSYTDRPGAEEQMRFPRPQSAPGLARTSLRPNLGPDVHACNARDPRDPRGLHGAVGAV